MPEPPVPSDGRHRVRIAYLCHEPLPAVSTYAEQMVSTVAELATGSIAIDLIHPRVGPRRREAHELRAELGSFYGIAAERLGPGLSFVELEAALPASAWAGQTLHDLRAARVARGGRYDLVYTRDRYAATAALLLGARVVFETYRADLGVLGRYAPWRRLCYPSTRFLGIVTHSDLARRSFLAGGLAPERVLVAYNGHDPERMRAPLERGEARRRLGLGAAGPIALYAGHVGRRKGTDMVLELAARLPELRFVLLGGLDSRLRAEAGRRGLANLEDFPRVPPAAVAPWLWAADLLLIPPSAAPLARHRRTVLPMKTFLYLAAGRAIVAPRLPDVSEVLRDDDNAVLVPPDQSETAVTAIRALLADPARAERLARQALADAARYTWAGRARLIADFLAQRSAA